MIGCIVIAMRPEDTLPNEQDLQQK